MSVTVGTTVTSANAATTTNTSLAVTLATTTVGELNVIEISGLANGTTINPTMTTPAGWTKVGELLASAGTPASFVAIYARVYQSGDGTSVTISWTNAGQMVALCTQYAGINTTTPVPYSVFANKAASNTSYSISGTTTALGSLNYGFANRTGTAWSALTDTTRNQVTVVSSDTMVGQYVPGDSANGTAFTKSATGSNTSVGVQWAYVVAPSTATFSGTAAFTGSGSLTATAVPKPVATAALTGSGTLTGAAVPRPVFSVALTGSGTLTATSKPTPAFTAALTGAGTLTGSGVAAIAFSGSVALSGSGSLSGVGKPTLAVSIALASSGTLTGTGIAVYQAAGTAAFTSSGLLVARQQLGSVLHPDNGAPDYRIPRFVVRFTPPTAAEGVNEGPLVLRMTALPRGITLVRKGNSIQQVRFPTEDDLNASDSYWRGGYTYYLTGDDLALLKASGYDAYLTDMESDQSSYSPVAYSGNDLYPGFYPSGDPGDAAPSDALYPGFYPGEL